MKNLKLLILSILLLLSFSEAVSAKRFCLPDFNYFCDSNFKWRADNRDKFFNLKKLEYSLYSIPGLAINSFIDSNNLNIDYVVPGLIGDSLYATGDIYIESEYFFDNVAQGLSFNQKGGLYFEPLLPADYEKPDFLDFSFVDGVGFFHDRSFPVDYFVTAESGYDLVNLYSLGDIYVIDSNHLSEVPLPPSGALFLISLLGLASRRFIG